MKMDKEVSVNPTNCDAYFIRGGMKCLLDDNKNGLKDLEISEKLGYTQAGLYMTKALAKNALEDFNGAKSDVSIAIKKEPLNLSFGIHPDAIKLKLLA